MRSLRLRLNPFALHRLWRAAEANLERLTVSHDRLWDAATAAEAQLRAISTTFGGNGAAIDENTKPQDTLTAG